MKHKKIAAFMLLMILLYSINIPAFANVDEYCNDWFEASGANELSEYLTEETRDYLKKIGCEDADFEGIFDISFSSFTKLIKDILTEEIKTPLEYLLKTVGAVLLVSVCAGFFPDDEKSKTVLALICGSFLIIEIFAPAMQSVSAAALSMGACAAFEKALIPVLAAVVTVSGNPASALSVHGTVFAAAQFVEAFAADTVMPLVGICGALSMTGSVFPTLRLSAVSETVKKSLTTCLASAAGLFTGFLALKSTLAASVDGMAVKGVKLAANTFIPVIGGAIGEAFTSVAGSLSLVKNTVGVYAIVAFFIMTVPVIINLALWVIVMRIACLISDLLGCIQCSEVIKSIAFVFSMTNTILVLCAAVFIISSGIVVFIGTGE
ncbi:MAG: hypothetical protein IJB16_04850 [Clostridia bacterium]|nr:hypothetical protein [Clostridia bacterium]